MFLFPAITVETEKFLFGKNALFDDDRGLTQPTRLGVQSCLTFKTL